MKNYIYTLVLALLIGKGVNGQASLTKYGNSAGYGAGSSNIENSFFGYYAGFNGGGSYNTFLGANAGDVNLYGVSNIFIGRNAGLSNYNGNYNSFIGSEAGENSWEGNYNTFLGYKSGYLNDSGNGNIFIGSYAGYNEMQSDKLYIDNSSTSTPLIYGDFLNNKLTVHGNLGIGTSQPAEKLEVLNGLIKINSATNEDNNSPGIVLASNDDFLFDGQYINQYAFGFHGFQDGSTSHSEPKNAYMSGYFGVDFFTSGQNRMRISHDGIVSIGTVNRQVGYKLAVNGNIKAKEIKVETGWSDFVFESNYNLPTLEEVEQHIKDNGHLKDIPSAKEVAENGIFLGDMNAKLLQKIEELTLYTIEQEKKIESQKKVNQDLKERLLKIEQVLLKEEPINTQKQ